VVAPTVPPKHRVNDAYKNQPSMIFSSQMQM
jgi:hypothetical protein